MDSHKYTQKETPTNLVRRYRKSPIVKVADIETLIAKVKKTEGFEIGRVNLLDSSPKNTAGWFSLNIDAGANTLNLAQVIQEHHADFISIEVQCSGTWVWVSVDMQSWTVSMSTPKKTPAALDEFAKTFGF